MGNKNSTNRTTAADNSNTICDACVAVLKYLCGDHTSQPKEVNIARGRTRGCTFCQFLTTCQRTLRNHALRSALLDESRLILLYASGLPGLLTFLSDSPVRLYDFHVYLQMKELDFNPPSPPWEELNGWIAKCEKEHAHSRTARLPQTWHIDVNDRCLRRLNPDDEYAALSYV